MVEFVGLSGQVKFDTSGLRTQFQLDLMELQMDGLVKNPSHKTIVRLLEMYFRQKLGIGTILTS